MLAGIREILIITTPDDQSQFLELLGDGSEIGISLKYAVQSAPRGLADALIIGEEFLGSESCLLILGDNIFHGAGLGREIAKVLPSSGAHIFTYEVSNPSDFGILTIDESGKPLSVIEKPTKPATNLAVTGLYFFDGKASQIAKFVQPSNRGELEITAVISEYLELDSLTYTKLSRGSAWLDTGNPKALSDATAYVRIIEERTGFSIACIEEIAYTQGWMSVAQLKMRIELYKENSYGTYLQKLALES